MHFALAGELDLPWLRSRIGILPAETHWQTLAKAALRDDLAALLRAASADALSAGRRGVHGRPRNAALHERFRQILDRAARRGVARLAMLSVAMRELRNLASR